MFQRYFSPSLLVARSRRESERRVNARALHLHEQMLGRDVGPPEPL